MTAAEILENVFWSFVSKRAALPITRAHKSKFETECQQWIDIRFVEASNPPPAPLHSLSSEQLLAEIVAKFPQPKPVVKRSPIEQQTPICVRPLSEPATDLNIVNQLNSPLPLHGLEDRIKFLIKVEKRARDQSEGISVRPVNSALQTNRRRY